jgi:phosphohistidine phosphatase
MNIYLLRHGPAARGFAPRLDADRLRPLTSKGRKKTAKVAAAMKRMGLSLDLIFSSPCLRARQTAMIVAEAFGARKKLEFLKELSVEANSQSLVDRLGRQHLLPESLLLVGHEPHLSGVASLLLTGKPGLLLELKKAGLCKLSIPALKRGRHATLEWLLTPKQMLAMK